MGTRIGEVPIVSFRSSLRRFAFGAWLSFVAPFALGLLTLPPGFAFPAALLGTACI